MHVTPAGKCACGKERYVSRKTARHAAKANHPDAHLSPYRCGRYWHYGHLKKRVLEGSMTRDGQKDAIATPPTVIAQIRAMWEGTRPSEASA